LANITDTSAGFTGQREHLLERAQIDDTLGIDRNDFNVCGSFSARCRARRKRPTRAFRPLPPIAMLLASVPPEVNTISAGRAPTSAAT